MRVDILGVKIDALDFEKTLSLIEAFIEEGGKHLVVTPYAESIVAAQKDFRFRRILNEAALAVPDGSGLLAAAQFLKESAKRKNQGAKPLSWALFWEGLKAGGALLFNRKYFDVIKEPVSGVDLMASLCRRAAEKGWKVFLLGGWGDAGAKAAGFFRRKYPRLRVASFAGAKSVGRETSEERTKALAKINSFAPHLLFVAFGPVGQEKWLAENLSRLDVGVAMGVGGAFDFVAKVKPRAPLFLRRAGLEWLWRLLVEPRRLGRIFRAVVVFPLLVFRHALRGADS